MREHRIGRKDSGLAALKRLMDAEERKQEERTKKIAMMAQVLTAHGFIMGPRDWRLNTDFPGEFMVAEPYTDEDVEPPTKDGRNGPWCIVGKDIEPLIEEAYNCGIWQL